MTRLKQYINKKSIIYDDKYTDSIFKLIRKDCKPYLKMIKPYKEVFYRGTDQGNVPFLKRNTRTDRYPLTMNVNIHKILDKVFSKHFGWKVRSEGVFTSGDEEGAEGYGDVYLFFPIGKFDYVFSPGLDDLFMEIRHIVGEDNYRSKTKFDVIEQKLDDYIEEYYVQNKDLKYAFDCGEVVFNCKSYYLVRLKNIEERWETDRYFIEELVS